MKELIEFLDKRGLKDKADSLRKGGTMLGSWRGRHRRARCKGTS
ncbi:MAG: hypothetical protein IRF12RH_07650 [Rickettsia helvetica]|uniref:Uncharacterized protein n=1 Tax=Rickettsia helvetica TaxID=35789 RepID=A0ABP0T6B4_RICHE